MSLIPFNGPITEKGTIPLQESRPIIEDHGCLRWLALIELKHPIVEEEMLILFLVFQNDHQIKRMKNFIISVKFYDFSLLFLYF